MNVWFCCFTSVSPLPRTMPDMEKFWKLAMLFIHYYFILLLRVELFAFLSVPMSSTEFSLWKNELKEKHTKQQTKSNQKNVHCWFVQFERLYRCCALNFLQNCWNSDNSLRLLLFIIVVFYWCCLNALLGMFQPSKFLMALIFHSVCMLLLLLIFYWLLYDDALPSTESNVKLNYRYTST